MARFNRILAQALVILGLAPVACALGLLGWQVNRSGSVHGGYRHHDNGLIGILHI